MINFLYKNLDRIVIRTLMKFPQARFILGNILNRKSLNVEKNVLMIGGMNGYWYGDNSKYIFEHLLREEDRINFYWVTRNYETYKLLRETNRVLLMYTPKWLSLIKRTKVGIYTDSLRDITIDPFFLPKNIELVNLRHGRSVKRVRYARLGHKISKKEKVERDYESELTRAAISTSDFVSKIQEECLRIGLSKHIVTGYPRNDFLFNPGRDDVSCWNKYKINQNIQDSEKTILYAPSWRHGREPTKFFPFENFTLTDFDKFLKGKQCHMLIRPHVGDLKRIQNRNFFVAVSKCTNIHVASHDFFSDANSLLPFVDGLISDYSAIYHDYLLLDRPLGFIPYDYNEFEKLNGFLYDYFGSLPGPSILELGKLKLFIDSLINGNDEYVEQRSELRRKIHKYQDDNSTYRTTDFIKGLMNER